MVNCCGVYFCSSNDSGRCLNPKEILKGCLLVKILGYSPEAVYDDFVRDRRSK